MQDSLFAIRKQEEIARLETAYQTRQKQNDIVRLRQQAQLQATEQERVVSQRNFFIASMLAALSLAIGLFVRYQMSRENLRAMSASKALIEARDQEKSLLLQEMHHRIKNHLQLVMSLLGTQTYAQSEANTKQVLRESRDRTFAIALLHEQLYRQSNSEDDTRRVAISPYLTELTQHLRDSFDRPDVTLQTQIDPIWLDVQAVVPLGLIVSEAVTNAYKYAAFPPNEGLIRIQITSSKTDYTLVIQDNGRLSVTPAPGFGLMLIEQLAEQLHGNVAFQSNNGFTVEVVFSKNTLA